MDMTILVSPESKRAAAVRLQAERLGRAKSAVTIACGLSSRHKAVRVEGMDAAEAVGRIGAGDALIFARHSPALYHRHSRESGNPEGGEHS